MKELNHYSDFRIAIACCVLHNIALERRQPLDEEEEELRDIIGLSNREETLGFLKRDRIAANFENIEVSFKWHLY